MRNKTTTLLYRWFEEIWNEGLRTSIDDLASEDVIAHGLGPDGQMHGIEAFKKFYDEFRTQLKNVHVNVEDVVCQDDIEAALCTVTGTDAAGDKRVEFSGICMVKIKDGKIVEAWNHYDFLTMYQQLGYSLSA